MYHESYLKRLSVEQPLLAQAVKENTKAFVKLFNDNFDFRSHITALFLGNVQSGKTAQILGVISRLAEEDMPLFVFLTTDNVYLHKQTLERVKASFTFSTNCGEHDDIPFLEWKVDKPLILVLKKNTRVLKKWKDLLGGKQVLRGKPIVFIDDEADAASLNTLVNRNRISTINNHLSEIKKLFSSSLYVELTATPQSILLQSSISNWKPKFVYYFPPGSNYIGGNMLFSNPNSFAIRFTSEFEFDEIKNNSYDIPEGLRTSLLTFLVTATHFSLLSKECCNFLIHPSIKTIYHEAFAEQICGALNNLIVGLDDSVDFDEICKELENIWFDLQKTQPDITAFDDIKVKLIELLAEGHVKVKVINSKTFIDTSYTNGYNIIIGGNSLSRGVTIPNLQVVYYCRKAKTYQADTYWQHSRVFGYDRIPGLIRIFLPKSLRHIFADINESNNVIIKQIENNGLENIQIVLPKGTIPTRKNVVDNRFLNTTAGGANYFPNNPNENNGPDVDRVLADFAADIHTVNDRVIFSVLKGLGEFEDDDWDLKKFLSSFTAVLEKRPKLKLILIVRRDRNISKGTGTLLSPTDRDLGDKHSEDFVLTMYKVNGNISNGWKGKPFWIPNIKFPKGIVFYDIKE